MKFLLIALLIGAAYAQQEITFTSCGGGALVNSVKAYPCSSQPCTFKKGSIARLEVDITAHKGSQTLAIDAKIKVAGLFIPIPGVEKDACKIISCPVQQGKRYVASIEVPVSKSYPTLDTIVKLQLIGDNQEVGICGEGPIRIVD